ncbi:MAG: PKD domain-containing protein, partial [Thermoplasmatota archaeon]
IMKINKDLDDSLIYQTRVADLDLGNGTAHKYPSEPYILYGYVKDVDDTPAEDNTVYLKNINTSKEMEIITDENGYFEFNLGNLDEEGYSDSDEFLLKSGDDEKKFSIDDRWGKKIKLELTDFEKPVIDDKSDPSPKTGEEYSFNIGVEDKSEIIKNKVRYSFNNRATKTKEIEKLNENEYEVTVDIPEDAEELSYNFTAVDLAGNKNITKTTTIEVEDIIKPVAKIGKDISVSIYEDFTLDVEDSYDNIGIKTYRWIVDSETIEGESITHNYSTLGNHEIKLIVQDHADNKNSSNIRVNVFDKERPEAVVEVSSSIDLKDKAILDAAGSSDNGNIVNYTWSIEGLDKTLYGEKTEVSFESPGNYNVNLKIMDSGNNTDNDFKNIEVLDRTSPEVKIDYRSEVDVDEEINFDASDSTDNHKIRTYRWDFGDGYKGTGEKVKHSFENEGDYTVQLTVEDESGNTITENYEVRVNEVESEKSSEKETPGFQILYIPLVLILALYIRKKRR